MNQSGAPEPSEGMALVYTAVGHGTAQLSMEGYCWCYSFCCPYKVILWNRKQRAIIYPIDGTRRNAGRIYISHTAQIKFLSS